MSIPVPRSGTGEPFPEHYHVRRLLKSAAGVRTLLATDLRSGRLAVLKTASSLSLGARLRLAHEATVLDSLSGRGLVPLLEHGADGDAVFLALPYVDGVTLRDLLARRPLSLPELLAVAGDLLAALDVTHRRGVLHRDVKPSNVIVTAAAGEPAEALLSGAALAEGAVLVDFGLSRSDRLDPAMRDEPVGTARYVSPEQAGLLRHEVDERSDLYSLGAVLFEAASGRPPFAGDTVGDVLRAHLSAPVPELRSLGLAVPRALDGIVARLLRQDPRDRYRSAAGVLADVEDLAAAMAAGRTDPDLTVGAHDRRPTLTQPAFVGRERELSRLASAAAAVATGEAALVLLESESGGGKTWLLQEFAQRCLQRGSRTLHGQGVDQTAQQPFQMLDGVVAGLLEAARVDPAFGTELHERLGDQAAAVRDALPALAPLLPAAEETLGPEEHAEQRSVQALAALLDVLGSEEQPAVVLLDDCQWSDEISLKLLDLWNRQRLAAGNAHHVLVVAAFRSDEVPPGHLLRRLRAARVRLSPFGDDDVHRLVESMAGPVPRDALDVVVRLAAGSPFMAGAVLRGLVEGGALVAAERGWTVAAEQLAGAQSSREAAAFLARRLDLLPDATRRVLAAGAVIGKEFDLPLAADLAGTTVPEALAAVEEARRRHVVWVDRDELSCSFVHDKLRETLLGELGEEPRRGLHLRVARHIAAHEPDRVFDLAYHYAAAGAVREALPHALTAAGLARERHALALAEEQYRIATLGVAAADDALRLQVAEGYGDVLMLRGAYDTAAERFGEAMELVHAPEDRARLKARLGELAFRQGDVDTAVERLESALRALGRRVPRRRAGYLAMVVWETLVQVAHTLLPRRWIARRRLADGAADFAAARMYSRLAYAYWFGRGKVPTAWAHFREMNILERYPDSAELAQAYSEHAPVMTTIPWFSRGIAYAERSLRIRRELGDVWGQGQSLNFYGVTLYAASRFEEALEKLAEAARLLRRTGDQWELNTANWNAAYAHYRLGDLATATALAREVHRSGSEIGDHHAAGAALAVWAKASDGDIAEDLISRENEARVVDPHTTAELLQAEGLRLLAAGDPVAAGREFDQACAVVRGAGLQNEYVAPVLPWRATALRMRLEAVAAYDVAARRRVTREAHRVARRAVRRARLYRNNLPHALRELALVAALRGRRQRAELLLARAATVADQLDMRGELAQVEIARARLALAYGVAGAELELRQAEATRDALRAPLGVEDETEAVPSLGLLDRFDSLLEVGRRIASALGPQTVRDAVLDGARMLFRTDGCGIVELDELGRPPEESSYGVSSALVRRAVESGRSVVYGAALDEDPSDSIMLSGARSALAAPVLVRGRAVACLTVVHQRVTGLFGEEDQRLADFLVALAGAALENTEGFEEVQRLTWSLEQRVAARTAELSSANEALHGAMDRLETANRELRALDDMKSDFVAMVSHELRTPLTSIVGYAGTMLRRWDRLEDRQKQEWLEVIQRESQRLHRLVANLLKMSQIEAGYLVTELETVPLTELVAQLVAGYGERAVRIGLDVPGDLGVEADRDHLQRVLVNFLDNAFRYGGEPVRLAAAEDGSHVVITVTDAGPGVPEEFVPRLFEKFAQASTGTRRGATGTGLGLSIVRGLAEAMNGNVFYEPATGGGARFGIRLRRAMADRRSVRPPATGSSV